jgi:hypothetical protein
MGNLVATKKSVSSLIKEVTREIHVDLHSDTKEQRVSLFLRIICVRRPRNSIALVAYHTTEVASFFFFFFPPMSNGSF